jgi:hypothetical protein
VKIVSRPEKTLTIQFRQFERPKKGGQMQLKASRTITLHHFEAPKRGSNSYHRLYLPGFIGAFRQVLMKAFRF